MRTCERPGCEQTFYAHRYRIDRGQARYCSRKCGRLESVKRQRDAMIAELELELQAYRIAERFNQCQEVTDAANRNECNI